VGEVITFPGPVERAERARLVEVTKNRYQEELVDVFHLLAYREADGSYPEQVLNDVFTNTVTDGYEAAVPNGVARVEQTHEQGDYFWMGQSSVQIAEGGYGYHKLPFAVKRVDVEVAEAIDARDRLVLGMAKVTISPRASRLDASEEEAKSEKLHDCDLVRVQYLRQKADGEVVKVIESIRVFDVPLDAWTRLLADEHNMFGRPIPIDDPESALSVLNTHEHTYVPLDRIADGPVSVFKAVLPYVIEQGPRQLVEQQIERFQVDQEALRRDVEHIAMQRQKLLVELADSLAAETASEYVQTLLEAHEDQLGGQGSVLIKAMRQEDGHIKMNIEIAKLASKINKNLLFARAGVVTKNESIVNEIAPKLVEQIRNEHIVSMHNFNQNLLTWEQLHQFQQASDRQIAAANVTVGGACSAIVGDLFGQDRAEELKDGLSDTFKKEANYKFDKLMHCVVCQAPPKKGDTKKMCGPCGICLDCDTKIRAKTAKAA